MEKLSCHPPQQATRRIGNVVQASQKQSVLGNMSFSCPIGRVEQQGMSIPRLTVRSKRQLHARPPSDGMQQSFQAIRSGEFPKRRRRATNMGLMTPPIQRDPISCESTFGWPPIRTETAAGSLEPLPNPPWPSRLARNSPSGFPLDEIDPGVLSWGSSCAAEPSELQNPLLTDSRQRSMSCR
jgi:hypothetical protein